MRASPHYLTDQHGFRVDPTTTWRRTGRVNASMMGRRGAFDYAATSTSRPRGCNSAHWSDYSGSPRGPSACGAARTRKLPSLDCFGKPEPTGPPVRVFTSVTGRYPVPALRLCASAPHRNRRSSTRVEPSADCQWPLRTFPPSGTRACDAVVAVMKAEKSARTMAQVEGAASAEDARPLLRGAVWRRPPRA